MSSREFAERMALRRLEPWGEWGDMAAACIAWVVNATGKYSRVVTADDVNPSAKSQKAASQRQMMWQIDQFMRGQMARQERDKKKAAKKQREG